MKKKYILPVLILCFFGISKVNAQELTPKNTFLVVAKQNSSEAELASKCIEKSDFSSHRLRDARRKLTFENGVIVELLSANELKNLGYAIDPTFYPEKIDKKYVEPIYSITTNGDLIQNHQPTTKYKGQ